jgi:preprotein translocase subunit SecD
MTMMIKVHRFNKYFLPALAMALAVVVAGCQSSKAKKKMTATLIELHLEANQDSSSDHMPITISRDPPVVINVEKEGFVDGGDVAEARVVEDALGFKLQLQFNWRGTQLLESATAANRGKRIAVFCAFGPTRWLGAPQIRNKISDGVLTFTPDATREEADRIVKGLNEVAAEIKKKELL